MKKNYFGSLDTKDEKEIRECCLPRKTQKVGNHGISRNKAV